jgi:hypothetical protein
MITDYELADDNDYIVCPICGSTDIDYDTLLCNSCLGFISAIDDDDNLFEMIDIL